MQFPPAIVTANDGATAPIFGADLFTGAFAGSTLSSQPDYAIHPGDVIELKTYGSLSLDLVEMLECATQLGGRIAEIGGRRDFVRRLALQRQAGRLGC